MHGSWAFAAIVVAFSMLIGRRVAWAICRKVLYPLRLHAVAALGCVLWGLGLALALRLLIIEFQPHWAVKWFLGYGLGGYLAFINCGLIDDSTVPPEAQTRHLIIEIVPLVTFIVASITLAWLPGLLFA
jgi:hypothetical protein